MKSLLSAKTISQDSQTIFVKKKMYGRERLFREESTQSRKNLKNEPSFSSTLLDEIYRSIDGNAGKTEDLKLYKEKQGKRQCNFRVKSNINGNNHSIEDEEMESFRRACLVEKWMEKEGNEKFLARKRNSVLPEFENKSLQDSDLLFFSSTSSSNSDSSGALSSSDTEFFGSTTKSRVSCFSSVARPKPVRTVERYKREECFSFDDSKKIHQKNKMEDDLIKSKSRALKIYANLKKVKQPISPGGKLTSFINSLFNNANEKKSKNLESNKGVQVQVQDLKSPKLPSNCSSASSFSRSCLSKYSPKSREKMRNGIQRTVRFNPVSIIVDEDSRPCGHKSIIDEDSEKFGRPPLPQNPLTELKLSLRDKNRKVEEATQNVLKGYHNNQRKDEVSIFRKIPNGRGGEEEDDDNYNDDDDYDDARSDSSSDLFELDHLSLFTNNRFCEELPVYETTHFNTNRAIASGLIR